jgi:PadR family transcriptional regulator
MYRMVPTGPGRQSDRETALIAQLRRGTLEYCVLALLERGERYGFDLVRELAEVDGMVTTEGTIYPMLARLRRDGAVETTWRESPAGPPRRYYTLTRSGRQALKQFREEWVRFRDGVDQVVSTS